MAFKEVLNTRFQLLCDTSEAWELNNTKVLLKGEPGIEILPSGKAKIKVGTGDLPWKDLAYTSEDIDLTDIEKAINELQKNVTDLQTLIGVEGPEATGIFATLNEKANKTEVFTKDEISKTYLPIADFNALADKKEYEITSTPIGTQVSYLDKEIRVMCPKDTEWKFQTGAGDPNMYYMGFKAYAPEGAVSFKEDDLKVIEDQTMYYFEDNSYAGIDSYGRKYSIVWLALAQYDTATGTWNYFGKSSSTERYMGWYYSVEWYDADGRMIHSDCIRINLSNEECHNTAQPYYVEQAVNKAIEEAKIYTDGLIVEVVEF